MGFSDSLLKFNPRLFNYYEKKAKKGNKDIGRNSPDKQLEKAADPKSSTNGFKSANEKHPYDTLGSPGRLSSEANDVVDSKFKSFRVNKNSI